MEKSDEQLIFEYQEGNTKSFEELFERFKNRIFNFSLRMLENRADAEDVTSDVFITLHIKKDLYTPKAKFSTWLFTIARNQCLDKIRNKRRMLPLWFNKKDGTNEDKEWEIPDKSNLAPDEMQKQETISQVKKAVQNLPADLKEALVLREYQGFSYLQISQILNCTLEQVKILIFRARENLKANLPSILEGGNHD
ncbi:MAG: RNA polymerase sigma factor [Candidatus Omnitrophica bacterium]|nr:RNA polymerase sigma factor [Candidatus Omnitrophota bacterium]